MIVKIPARAQGKILVVEASIGEARAHLVVDSGAGTSALSIVCASRLGFSVREGLHVRTPTGLTSMGAVVVPNVKVGPLQVSRMRMAAVPLQNDRVDGLLGLDFFRAVGAKAVTLLLDSNEIEVRLS